VPFFLDQGMDQASQFLDKFLLPVLILSLNKKFTRSKKHISGNCPGKEGITPNYSIINESGPDHQKLLKSEFILVTV
jgi:dsRNA-specific ribonuclease